MTNEKLVYEIQRGENVSTNMQKLYDNNLPFLRLVIRPYVIYSDENDLLQES